MDKNWKTIKELADEIGVSKQAIFYRIKKEPLSNELSSLTSKENGSLMFSFDGQTLIKEAFNEKNHQTFDGSLTSKENTSFDTSLIQILQEELLDKNNQLVVKDRQIESLQENISELTSAVENLTKSLNSSHALHAGTMQQKFISDTQSESIKENEENRNSNSPKSESFWSKFFRK